MMEQLIGSILANRLRYFLVALAVAVASAFTVVSLTLADYTDTALRGSRTANFGRAQAAVKIADASDGRDAAQAVERLDSVSKAYTGTNPPSRDHEDNRFHSTIGLRRARRRFRLLQADRGKHAAADQ